MSLKRRLGLAGADGPQNPSQCTFEFLPPANSSWWKLSLYKLIRWKAWHMSLKHRLGLAGADGPWNPSQWKFQFLIPSNSPWWKLHLQGVPKKTLDSVWWAIEGTRSGLETKVEWVLKNSGNILSDEHKNSSFLSENIWEKLGQRRQPPLRKGMIVNHPEDIFLCSNLKDKIDW